MSRPRVSICLPTWNGEAHLRQLLPALARQELEGGFELLAIDSESTDRTRELLQAAGARVQLIEKRAFRHGPARNRCAEGARGEILVFLSQDALPADERFLAALAGALDDPTLAAATARVLPRPGDDPLTARTALDRPEASERPRVRGPGGPAGRERPPRSGLDSVPAPVPDQDLDADSDSDSDSDFDLNDVASAIRAAVFRELPFPDVPFGEDVAWAEAALAAGHRIAFVPAAVCYHAHAYGPREAFERYRIDAAFHLAHSGRRVRPSFASVLRGIAHEVRADWRHLARHPTPGRLRHLARSPLLRSAQVLGQLWGSRGWGGGLDTGDSSP